MSNQTTIVADADVLAADILCDSKATPALEPIFRHDWLTLTASEQLLHDARAIIEALEGTALADSWLECIEDEVSFVDHPDTDHPALGSAYAAGATHIITYDESLTSAAAAVHLQSTLPVSIRTPMAFVRIFDVAALYEAVFEESYPGPDRPPRPAK